MYLIIGQLFIFFRDFHFQIFMQLFLLLFLHVDFPGKPMEIFEPMQILEDKELGAGQQVLSWRVDASCILCLVLA